MRERRIGASLLAGSLLLGCGEGGTGPEPTIAEVRLAAPSAMLFAGDEMQVVATVLDSRQQPVDDCELEWRSGDDDVMTVSAAGLVRARGPGSTTITARCEEQEGSLTLGVEQALPVQTSGTIFTLPEAPLDQFYVTLRDAAGGRQDVLIGSGESFTLRHDALTRKVYVDVEGVNEHLRSSLEFDRDAVWSDLRFVVAPSRWEIGVGSYAARIEAVRVRDAFEPPCSTPGEPNCDGYFPIAWIGGIKLRDETRPPMPVAFDHGRSATPITASDSIAFWQTVAQMEADFGSDLFVPATISNLTVEPDGWSEDAVVVRIDNTLAASSAYANWRWDGDGNIYAGLVRFGSPSGMWSSGLVTHELLHTIGFKHTCSWPSVMGGYGCPMSPRLTSGDVAHAALAFAVRAAQRRHGAPFGLIATLNGERGSNYIPTGSIRSQAPVLLRLNRFGGEDGAR